jgi:hypothetical protein
LTIFSVMVRERFISMLFLMFFCTWALGSYGSVINVPENFETIQEALNQSSEGDMIHVSPGTYQENLVFPGIGVSLCSLDPTSPTLVQQTIIDGSLEEKRVITLSGNEPTTATISGFTLMAGNSLFEGGCIYGQRSKITIENNVIEENKASLGGGGLADCDGLIINNIIQRNTAKNKGGGGISGCDGKIINNYIYRNWSNTHGGGGLAYCDGFISNNTILRNSANGGSGSGGRGGGLYDCGGKIIGNLIMNNSTKSFYSNGVGGGVCSLSGVIENNIFANNSAGFGGGLAYCSGTFSNNLVYRNSAIFNPPPYMHMSPDGAGGGLYHCEFEIEHSVIYGNKAYYFSGGCTTAKIVNSIVWGNEALRNSQGTFESAIYSCIQGWTDGGEGMTSVNPLFVDSENGNFRLQPSSSLIDAGKYLGAVGGDFLGNPRPVLSTPEGLRGDGSGYDIGAFEFQGEATIRVGSQWALY